MTTIQEILSFKAKTNGIGAHNPITAKSSGNGASLPAWLTVDNSAALPRILYVVYTPAICKRLLDESPGNRHEKPGEVDKLVREILNGTWDPANALIHIDEDGKLANGHHRCKAIIKTGATVVCATVIGYKREGIAALDDGVPRTILDKLRMLCNVKVSNQSASAVRAMLDIHANGAKVGRSISYHDFERGVVEHEKTTRWLLETATGEFTAATWGALGFAYGMFPEKIDEFASLLKTKVGLTPGSPVIALLKFLDHADTAGFYNRQLIIWKTLSCAAAFVRGDTRDHVKDTDAGLRWFREQAAARIAK